MATEPLTTKHDSAKTVYFRLFDVNVPAAPLGWCVTHSAWEASPHDPKVPATEETIAGDADESLYAATVDLALLYNSATPKAFAVQAVDDLATDEIISVGEITLSSGRNVSSNADVLSSTRSTQAQVWSDGTPVAGIALNTLASHDPGETIMGATDLGTGAGFTSLAQSSVVTELRLAELDAANLPADVANVKADTAAILADTGTDGVVVATASKTGYALSSAGVLAIWNVLTSALTTVGSIGKLIVDYLSALGGTSAYSITVTVSDSLGAALSGKRVQLTNAGGIVVGAPQSTNASGQVVWYREAGEWTVQILGDSSYTWDAASKAATITTASIAVTFTGTAVTAPAALARSLGTLMTEVRDECGNRGTALTILTNARIIRWLNQAKDDIAQVWNTVLLEQRDTVTLTNGTSTLDLGNGAALSYVPREILGIYIKDTTNKVMYPLTRIEHKTVLEDFADAFTPSDKRARPEQWSQVGMTLHWHKRPDAGKILTVAVGEGGTGYAVNDVLTIGGDGTEGTVTVTAVTGGVVTAIQLTTAGLDYSAGTKPTTGGGGSNCTITITTQTYSVVVLYRYIPGDLTDSTESNLLTNYAANALMCYATARAFYFLEQSKSGDEWMQKYANALKQLVTTESKRMTQGLSRILNIGSYRE